MPHYNHPMRNVAVAALWRLGEYRKLQLDATTTAVQDFWRAKADELRADIDFLKENYPELEGIER